MSILDIFKISKIKKSLQESNQKLESSTNELKNLKNTIIETGANDAIKLKEFINEKTRHLSNIELKINDLEEQKSNLELKIKELENQIITLDEETLLESFSLYKPKFSFTNSLEYKNKLDELRIKQKEFIKADAAATAPQGWTVDGSLAQGKKMIKDMKKLLLRSFHNECDYCIDNVKFNNIESYRSRLEKSFEALNKLGAIASVSITYAYRELKIQELDLAFEYQEKKQEEKEELRRIREEQREQQKLDQEIKNARLKIEKERKHFLSALNDLTKKELTASEEEKKEIQEKIISINEKIKELEGEEKIVDYRENNAKAGYVYIISNIGSFGDNVYKIGMTRRLEPYDRIQELSDASVPFTFDVHAMIFSDNAPSLEASLHNHFWKNRINKINNRKEFFKADLKEVESIVREHYDRVFDLVHLAPAEQYREGLKMQN